jgi:virulence-associated protein VapD
MVAIGAALLSGAISAGINWWNKEDAKKSARIGAAENANNSIRQYNELARQRQSKADLFDTNISTTYGNNFLDKLRSGADTATLLSGLSQGDTAFAKQLQAYDADARQAIENSVFSNRQTGVLAGMQGQQNAIGMMQQTIQAEQAQAAAVASQNVSGIRSDAGTGDNAQKMQEQANRLANESLDNQIALQNESTTLQMQSGQMTASQSAEKLRRQADITAQQAAEEALKGYANYEAEQDDMEASMQSHKNDYDYFKDNAGKESGRIDEAFVKFDDDDV